MKEATSEDSSSAIRQAYLAALQQELSSLYQLMAQLDALAGHPLPAGAAHILPHVMLLEPLPGTCHLQPAESECRPPTARLLCATAGSPCPEAQGGGDYGNAASSSRFSRHAAGSGKGDCPPAGMISALSRAALL